MTPFKLLLPMVASPCLVRPLLAVLFKKGPGARRACLACYAESIQRRRNPLNHGLFLPNFLDYGRSFLVRMLYSPLVPLLFS
jgi:hypothetical protein